MATDYVVRFTGQDNLSGTINQVKKNLEDVGTTSTKLDQIKQKFDKIEQSTAPLKRKLRDLKSLMAQMNFEGLSNTDLFNQMAQQAGTYADAIKDASTATSNFANDNYKLEAMVQGLTGIAGAASVATGVMSLLGKENEDVARAIQKVQAVLAILNGVQAVANVLNKDSALMLRLKQIRLAANTAATKSHTTALNANTIAENINTTANKRGTIAQNAWNVAKAIAKAICGDYTGLLLVGAGALLTYALATQNSTDKLEEQADATDKATKGLEKQQEALDNYRSVIARTTGENVGKFMQLRLEWSKLRTEAEKTQWINDNKDAFDKLGLSVNSLVAAENVFKNNTADVIKAFELRAQAAASSQLIQDAWTAYYEQLNQNQKDYDTNAARTYTYTGKTQFQSDYEFKNVRDRYGLKQGTHYDVKLVGTGSAERTVYTLNNAGVRKIESDETARIKAEAARDKSTADARAVQSRDNTLSIASEGLKESATQLSKLNIQGVFTNNNNGGNNNTNNTNNTNKGNPAQQPDQGSLAAEEAELQRLQNILRNTRFDSEEARDAAIQAVREQAEKVATMKAQLRWEVEPVVDMSDDSINGLNNQISALDKQIQEATDPNRRRELVIQRNAKIQLKEDMEIEAGLQEKEEETPEVKTKRDLYNDLKNKAYDVQSDFDDGLINFDEAQSRLAEINAQIAQLGGKPIKLEFQTNLDKINEQFSKGVSTISSVDSVVSSIKSLSQNLKDGADAWTVFVSAVNIASNVMSAITTAMELYNALSTIFTAKKTAEGVAATTASTAISTAEGVKAAADTASVAPALAATAAAKGQEAAMLDLAAASYFAAHASIPFAGFGIASGFVAGMMGIMTAQKAASSALSAFADGGIISGSTFHGDRMLARVNAGEMILNQSQQANLFRALNSGTSNGAVVSEVRIKGSDLYLALKNYNNKMSKIK